MNNMIKNPVLKGFNPDPAICRVGDDYYIAVSTFEWFPGVAIHHSKDLINWRLISNPLNRVSQLDMKGNPDSGGVWAPCLTYKDGMFWLIYSDVKVVAGSFKDVTNYLVTSDKIDGEWSEPIFMNQSGFDPSLFHDEDGKKYFVNMVWDPREGNHSFAGIILQEYDHAQKKLVGKKEIIYKGTELGLTEAPHIYKKDGYYYLLVAEGGTKFEHAAVFARSKNINGPYETHPEKYVLTSWPYPENPLQKSGHASIVETADGQWYMAHLMGRPIKLKGEKSLTNRGYCTLGRETSIQKMYWENDWPYVVGGPAPSKNVEAPNLTEVKWERDYEIKDDFDKDTLNHHFNTLRIPFNEEIGSLTANKGHLRLYGRESYGSMFTQSLVARRFQSFNFTAETKLSFNPSTFQQFAGLVCYYNTKNYVSCTVTFDEEKGKVIKIMANERNKAIKTACAVPVPGNTDYVTIKVDVNKEYYTFSYSFDNGETFKEIEQKFDTYKLSDDYIEEGGFFTGAFVGMSCIDLTGERNYTDFDYFKYEEN